MAKTEEGRTKDDIKLYLEDNHPGLYYFMPAQGKFAKKGVHDFVCCVPTVITQDMVGLTVGRFATIEAKKGPTKEDKKGGTATKLQLLHGREVFAAGGVACIAKGRGQTLIATLLEWSRALRNA